MGRESGMTFNNNVVPHLLIADNISNQARCNLHGTCVCPLTPLTSQHQFLTGTHYKIMWQSGATGKDGNLERTGIDYHSFFFVSHRFVLSSTESSSGAEPVIHFSGLSTEAVASGLKPFTQYTAVLEVGGANSCLLY